MSSFKIKLLAGVLVALIVYIGFLTYKVESKGKIAFVQSALVVDQFYGMQEVEKKLNQKAALMQRQLDSLRLENKKRKEAFSQLSTQSTGGAEDKYLADMDELLSLQEKQYYEELSKEREKLVQGALNQINAFIENYAEEKGFEMVLGTTLSGNILYGNKGIDITENIINELNQQYYQ